MNGKYLVKNRKYTVNQLLDSMSILMNAENNVDIFYYCIVCKEKAKLASDSECDRLLNIMDRELEGLYNVGFMSDGHFEILRKYGIYARVLWNGKFYVSEIDFLV